MTNDLKRLANAITHVNDKTFTDLALEIFRYQAEHCEVYRLFLHYLGFEITKVKRLSQIPYLPVSLFKTHLIQSGAWSAEAVFSSSSTTGQTPSRHLCRSLDWYTQNTLNGFESIYGKVEDWAVLALLPSYLEREGSSLVYMAEQFIKRSRYPESGFFLNNTEELLAKLARCEAQKIPTLLLGVSFALWDLAEQHPQALAENIVVMETGGMKGRRRELTRLELHDILKNAFHISNVHSEYGMTELLSQGYSKGNGLFFPAATLKVLARDAYDPFAILPHGKTGCLNLIDLANIDTCCFLATDDLGKTYADGAFEVMGRFDASEVRGCNLMIG